MNNGVKFNKSRARLEILFWITQFFTNKYYGGDSFGFKDPKNSFHSINEREIPIGSLVLLSSAPVSKWYISWLRDKKPLNESKPKGMMNYLLESIEDKRRFLMILEKFVCLICLTFTIRYNETSQNNNPGVAVPFVSGDRLR